MDQNNWDDLRFVLAVADCGSVSAAARQMGVNHATVLRRVAGFEARNGGAVFARSAHGYTLLADRTRVIEAAREVANAMNSVERLMQGAQAPLRGVVRVSTTDSFCQVVLPPLAARLNAQSTQLRIDLMSNNSHVDFARMQADISVRPAKTLTDEMRGEVAAHLRFATYCGPSNATAWLGLTGPLARSAPAEWIANKIDPENISGASDSFLVLAEMAAQGMGTAILPCVVGDRDNRLKRHKTDFAALDVPIWVASHIDLLDVPRLRLVRTKIITYLAKMQPALWGE